MFYDFLHYVLCSPIICHNYFLFDGIIYQQVDGVDMGSPSSLSLVDAFLPHHEQIWINDFPNESKPAYYKIYVDNIFALYQSPHHLEKFNVYSNRQHASVIFTNEQEVKMY